MKKIVALVLVLALSLGIVGIASARAFKAPLAKPYCPEVWGYPFLTQNMIKYLDLTDEQINKIKELRTKYYEKLKDLYAKLQDAVFSLRQLQLERQPDWTQIEKKREEIYNIRKEIRETLDKYWKEFKEILTKEQLSKLSKRFMPPYRVKRMPWDYGPFFRW